MDPARSWLVTGHLNDMVVDRAGGAYAGNFGFDLMAGEDQATTVLVQIAPDGTASVAAEDLMFPKTFGGRLTAFDIRPDGVLSGRRTFAEPRPVPEPGDLGAMVAGLGFAPDGIALDAEGHVWAANGVGAAVWRISPAGEVVEEVAMPEGLGVFACGAWAARTGGRCWPVRRPTSTRRPAAPPARPSS